MLVKFRECPTLLSFLVLVGGALLVAPQALAQEDDFPSRPIKVVIHSSYGGGTDITARMMISQTRHELGVDMLVVGKRGGAGALAHQYALDKARDGYTILALTQTHLYTIARGKSPLSIEDVVGIARAMDDPTFISVHSNSPYQSLDDLVKASEHSPLNWGVGQVGGTEHIGLAQFAKASGIEIKAIPFGSGAQMTQALLSGSVDAALPNVSEVGALVNGGTVRALAVMAERRLSQYPNVPTTFEHGYRTKTSTTRGYWVLKGTPPDRVKTLSSAMLKAMRHETFVSYLRGAGLTPEESIAGYEEWNKQIKEDYARAIITLRELGLLEP